MSLVKTSRLRKTVSTTDVTKTISGGDIKLEIYLETKTENGTPPISYEEWELKFITLDLPADVPMTKKYSNKDSQYGANQNEVLDFIVPDFIQLATLTKLRALSYTQAEAQELSKSYYGIIQDTFSEQAPLTRNYGTDGYFLNNGVEVLVRWNTGASVSIWNPNYVEAEIVGVNYSLADGSESWDQSLSLPGSTPSVPFIQTPEDMEFTKGEKKKIFKYVFAYNGTQSYMLSSGQIKLYEKPNEPDFFPGEVKDLDLVTKLVDLWKIKVPNYDLKISNPNYQAGGSLEFKDPLQGLSPSTAVADNTGSSVSTADEVKFELSIVYDKNVTIKADQDLPNIEIYVGEPPAAGEFLFDEDEFDDLALLDEEYLESDFDSEEESPSDLRELPPSDGQVESEGSSQKNIINKVSGKGVILPTGSSAFSHNESQGYNLVDSNWYGDILTSAYAHIEHPTFDIPLTESGNLGCASWVSMVFYRAYGLSMKTGKPVKAIPKAISDFGSVGTAELGGLFDSNKELWTQIPLEDGQAGDIVNTSKNFNPKASGHIGVVLDTTNKDGTKNIASNSSKGFGSKSDPLGCGLINYSIKSWKKKVYPRNPSKTWCWRYKGPIS